MATWQLIGVCTPVKDLQFLEILPTGDFFKLTCIGVPANSASFLTLQEWRDKRPGQQMIAYPLREQVFRWGIAGQRLIAIRKSYPIRAAPDLEDYQVKLEEWQEEAIPPDPEVGLWLPGNP
ncbi:hypothetical protein BST81_03525 [Leptolyngbya sp. 'hensonii']|uniref:hypothetical protein n=1 Tax=Leptolyngbya sp. 'hensonii' TaxID=1922337 RepID=UPI00094F88B8|nr:hypothetical protein [Leptolyngbya sp. 'hensonii']OLP19813.1 hypothetical protein BST81_03525 [Leptolyngbya sp. 'hensonii']